MLFGVVAVSGVLPPPPLGKVCTILSLTCQHGGVVLHCTATSFVALPPSLISRRLHTKNQCDEWWLLEALERWTQFCCQPFDMEMLCYILLLPPLLHCHLPSYPKGYVCNEWWLPEALERWTQFCIDLLTWRCCVAFHATSFVVLPPSLMSGRLHTQWWLPEALCIGQKGACNSIEVLCCGAPPSLVII